MATSFAHLASDVREALTTDLTIDITTTGRHSGRPRRIEIWFVNVDGAIYITGTPGRRDWLANLRAEPRLIFHLKQSLTADLAAIATEVTDQAERQRVFDAPSTTWYVNQGDSLQSLVDDAPLVRITFPKVPDNTEPG